jgi:hypothetical protein
LAIPAAQFLKKRPRANASWGQELEKSRSYTRGETEHPNAINNTKILVSQDFGAQRKGATSIDAAPFFVSKFLSPLRPNQRRLTLRFSLRLYAFA